MERVKGIEPSYSAWKAAALPLSYTRMPCRLDGGGSRTRTYEGIASGFTVRPLCRSGHSPVSNLDAERRGLHPKSLTVVRPLGGALMVSLMSGVNCKAQC